MGDRQQELQRRWRRVVAGESAAAVFADARPAWSWATYHSADIQIAAKSVEAIRRGDFRLVLGDFHGGDNPIAQGLFAHRHPQDGAVLARIAEEMGPGVHLLPPRRGVVEMTARAYPVYGVDGDVVVTAGDEPPPRNTRAVSIRDVVIETGARGTARVRSTSRSPTCCSCRSSSPPFAASTSSVTPASARPSGGR
jgi:hypothetical protein